MMRAHRPARIAVGATAAIVLALAATPARADEAAPADRSLWESTLSDPAAWLAEPGGPAWNPEIGRGFAPAQSVAGHAWFGWRMVDPGRAPEQGPYPGMLATLPPLAGYDSIQVRPASPPSAPGPAGALVTVRPEPRPGADAARPLATFAWTSGDFGLDQTSLTAERHNDLSRIAVESMSANTAEVASYGATGRHRWGILLGQRYGANEFTGTFRQAGTAARLAGGEEEAARGASGDLAWTWKTAARTVDLKISRQWDSRVGFGGVLGLPSRRDAQELRIEGGARVQSATRSVGARVDWHRAEVRRDAPIPWGYYGGDDWGWIDATDDAGGRHAALELGAGRIGALDRIELAPGGRVEWRGPGRLDAIWAQRLLQPVWHDLADGASPFLQNTWVVGVGSERRGSRGVASVQIIGGRTRDRALVTSWPLEAMWLEDGVRRDPSPWNFAQGLVDGTLIWRGWRVGGQACGLLRDDGAGLARQARVDPALTARVFGESRFSAFEGDLGVRIRLEGDYVGSRVVELPDAPGVAVPLDATWSSNASLTLIIVDAWITLRGNHLEGGEHPLPWRDTRTGELAVGTPRELRVSIAWKLRN